MQKKTKLKAKRDRIVVQLRFNITLKAEYLTVTKNKTYVKLTTGLAGFAGNETIIAHAFIASSSVDTSVLAPTIVLLTLIHICNRELDTKHQ